MEICFHPAVIGCIEPANNDQSNHIYVVVCKQDYYKEFNERKEKDFAEEKKEGVYMRDASVGSSTQTRGLRISVMDSVWENILGM